VSETIYVSKYGFNLFAFVTKDLAKEDADLIAENLKKLDIECEYRNKPFVDMESLKEATSLIDDLVDLCDESIPDTCDVSVIQAAKEFLHGKLPE